MIPSPNPLPPPIYQTPSTRTVAGDAGVEHFQVSCKDGCYGTPRAVFVYVICH